MAIHPGSDAIIANLPSSTSANIVGRLWEEAARFNPVGLDSATSKLRMRYNSKGEILNLTEMERRYPKTHDNMPIHESDTVRHVAVQDASVFGDEEPNIWLSFENEDDDVEGNEDREPTPEEEQRMRDFGHMVENSNVFSELQEGERWKACARNSVFGVRFDVVHKALTGEDKLKISRYWADSVRWIPFWMAPSDERAAIGIIIKTVGPDNRKVGANGDPDGKPEDWFELWTREVTTKNDTVEFHSWKAELIGTESGSQPLFGDGEYPLPTAPFLVMRDGLPDNTIYLDPGDTLLRTAVNIDLSWSSHYQRMDLNGSPKLFFDDPELEGDQLVVGPGEVY